MKSIWGNWSSAAPVKFYVDKNRYYHKALVYLYSATHPVSGPIFGHIFKTTKLSAITDKWTNRSSYRPAGQSLSAYVENEGFLLRLV